MKNLLNIFVLISFYCFSLFSGELKCSGIDHSQINKIKKTDKKQKKKKESYIESFAANATYQALDPSDPKYLWMDEQIEREFLPFSEGITREMLDQTQSLYPLYWRYRVENSQVIGPEGPVKQMLLKLIDLYTLPDVEFVYFEHDGFIDDGINRASPEEIAKFPHKQFFPEAYPGPILASAKHKDCSTAILFHDWYFHIDGQDPLNWPNLWKTIEKISVEIPWKTKIAAAFWRGTSTGYQHSYTPEHWKKTPRGQVCYLSYLFPHLINAGFCNTNSDFIIAAREREGIELYKSRADQAEHMKYKYQLAIDGHTCPFTGILWRMLSNCTVFLQETKNIMWFYSQMVPWIHYVPIKEDLSDLMDKIIWAHQHDKECQKIALQGQILARKTMLPNMTCLYCYKVLKKYASLQKF